MASVSPLISSGSVPVKTLSERFRQAELAIERGDFQLANGLLLQIVREKEDYAPGYFLLADIAIKVHQFERALTMNGFAERFMPQSFDVQFQRGRILFVLARWDDALASFEKAHALNPKEVMVLLLMGDALAQQKRGTEAMKMFDKAAGINDLPEVLEHKGLCQLSMNDKEGAAATFRTLLGRLPNHAGAHVELAKLDLEKDEKEHAEERIRKALMFDPKHQEALVLLAGLLKDRGDLSGATLLARQGIAANPHRVDMVMMALRPMISAGCIHEAEVALRTLLEVAPNDVNVMLRLVTILIPQGKHDEAKMLTDRALAIAPNSQVLKHTRASLLGETTAAAPEAYVANLFDGYANHFDSHLQSQLGYHTPRLIANAVRALLPEGKTHCSLLDLGCGTGLAAEALRDVTQQRVGIDLSPNMIEKALAKGIYSEAKVDELVRFMSHDARRYDLIVAADVLVYIGDLDPLFAQAATHLQPGGMFAFSVERETSELSYLLRPTGRYAHSEHYLRQLAASHGLQVVHCAPCDLRQEAGNMIIGTVMVLKAG